MSQYHLLTTINTRQIQFLARLCTRLNARRAHDVPGTTSQREESREKLWRKSSGKIRRGAKIEREKEDVAYNQPTVGSNAPGDARKMPCALTTDRRRGNTPSSGTGMPLKKIFSNIAVTTSSAKCGLLLHTSDVAWSACLCLCVCWTHW